MLKLIRKYIFRISLASATAIAIFLLSAWYWGFFGRIDKNKYNRILHSFIPLQREELASALNYYYENDIITRNTKGLVLCCDSSPESISTQFNWYHRNTLSYALEDMPDYHEVVFDALKTQTEVPENFSLKSTFFLELCLKKHVSETPFATDKDFISWGISGTSTLIQIFVSGLNPFIGLGLSGLHIIYSGTSDSAKAIPGIISFLNLRRQSFAVSFFTLWSITVFIIVFFTRKTETKRNKKKNKSK